jgi:citrate synthase
LYRYTPAHPNQKLSYAENFLYMLDAGLDPHHRPNPRLARALDVMFLLHAVGLYKLSNSVDA